MDADFDSKKNSKPRFALLEYALIAIVVALAIFIVLFLLAPELSENTSQATQVPQAQQNQPPAPEPKSKGTRKRM